MSRVAAAVAVLQLACLDCAFAQSSPDAEQILKSFLAEFTDVGPLKVEYGSIDSDAATGETRLKDLSVVWRLHVSPPADRTQSGGTGTVDGEMRVEVPQVLFANLRLADGRYAADRISVETMTMVGAVSEGSQSATFRVEGGGSEVVAPVWAQLPQIVFDPSRPASSYAPFAEWALSPGFASAKIGAFVTTVQTDDSTQTTRQESITMGTLRDGLLDEYASGPAVSQMAGTAEVDGTQQPLDMAMTIGAQTVSSIDYKPLMRFLTGAARPSGDYETVVERASADGMTIVSDLFSFRFGGLTYRGLKIRPSETSFLELLDGLIAGTIDENDSEQMLRYVLSLYGAFGIDLFEAREMSVDVPGQGGGRLGRLVLEDLSGEGLGRFGFGDLDIQGPDVSIQLGEFAIGDMSFPSVDAILALKAMGEEPDPVAIAKVIPQLGLFLLEGMSVLTPMADEPALLGTFRIEQGNFVPLPTRTEWVLEGLSLPLAYLGDETVKMWLAEAGADPFRADARFDVAWTEETQIVKVGPLEVDVPNIGELFFEGNVGGVPRTVFENPMAAQNAVPTLSFGSLQLFYRDKGLTPLALQQFAGLMGQTADTIPDALADQVEDQLLAVLHDDQALARETASAVRRFLIRPDTLKLSAIPATPVPVAQLLGTAAMAPATIPALLNLTLETNVAR